VKDSALVILSMIAAVLVAAPVQAYTIWQTPHTLESAATGVSISTGAVSSSRRITSSSIGDYKWAYLGLTLPSYARIDSVTVCYRCSGSNSAWIAVTRFSRMSVPSTGYVWWDDAIPRMSTAGECYTVNTPNPTVDQMYSIGFRGVFLSTSGWIDIGAVGIHVTALSGPAVAAPSGPAVGESILEQNRPNPFNPMTSVAFEIDEDVHAVLEIFDVRGELVRTLLDEPVTQGRYEILWDGRDDTGRELASGQYFYRLVAGDRVDAKKMILLR
jgi:hypothetical protein